MLYFKYIITILFVDGIYAESLSDAFATENDSVLTDENITKLDLSNNNLLRLKRETFSNYKQLKQLDIINSKVSFIDDGTFCDLEQLMELNMAKNFITRLNHNIFGPNKLWKFVISDNMLSDLKDFDINYFPNLKFFDISNNKLKTLPINLLEKLKKDKNFTISAKSNPWNCTNKNWTRLLDTVLFHKFCDDNQPEFVDEMPRFLAIEAPPKPSFISCAFWIAGAFWIGIIVGNIFLIRRTLFRKVNKTKVNQSTQFESFIFLYPADPKKVVTVQPMFN